MVRQSNTQTYPEIKKENLKPFLPHLSEPKKKSPNGMPISKFYNYHKT